MTSQRFFALAISLTVLNQAAVSASVGTAFTYQGRLSDNGAAANGSYDLTFQLFDAETNGNPASAAITNTGVAVASGLFTVPLDFGADALTGDSRWLEIGARTNGSAGEFTLLSPRQSVSPTPYAVLSSNALGIRVPTNQAFEVFLSSQRAMRIEPTSQGVNVLLGPASNRVSPGVTSATISAGGTNNVIESSCNASTISGGNNNLIQPNALGSTIGGGIDNIIESNAWHATIGGGSENRARGGTVAGGSRNAAIGGSIGGGNGNLAFNGSTVSGGSFNYAVGQWSTIGGGYYQNTLSNYATISGGRQNVCFAEYSTIGGGQGNIAEGEFGAVVGGSGNYAIGRYGSVGGGIGNHARGTYSTVGGGSGASAGALASTVAGGSANQVQTNADYAAIGGGLWNTIHPAATRSVIGGGEQNLVATNAQFAVVPGGFLNVAGGNYTFAAGRRAKANQPGAFVWADSSDFDFPSSATNEFSVRATGGVRFVSGIDTNGAPVAGVQLPAGSGSWSSLSDRNAKENLRPVDGRAVLEKVAALPLATWNYQSQEDSIRHIGPVAQDFHAAFHLGEDDQHIATVDADGVALAAIQGLNQKLEEQLKRKDAEIRRLNGRLAALEEMVFRLAGARDAKASH